jgi:hypothetical protein
MSPGRTQSDTQAMDYGSICRPAGTASGFWPAIGYIPRNPKQKAASDPESVNDDWRELVSKHGMIN